MQRFCSIATVLALFVSLISSNMMAMSNCEAAARTPSCHAAEAEAAHCDRAMHHHHQDAAAPGTSSFSLLASNRGTCPMDCCTPGHPESGTALAGNSILPLPAMNGQSFFLVSVIFLSAGFSSHTDRGPPLA